MSLPTQYLTSQKNLAAILSAIQQAKAPDKFTVRFLESLGFKSTSDRLIIGVLKGLKFLDEAGKPQERYFQYLDQTQAARVLGQAVEEAYADLFQVNTKAHTLSKSNLINKLKTLSQGSISESVLDKMSMTFTALCKLSEFDVSSTDRELETPREVDTHSGVESLQPENEVTNGAPATSIVGAQTHSLGGLHYNIQIILPESRDPKVYDALFRSLKEHLIQ